MLDVVNNIKQIDCNNGVATSNVHWYDTVNLSSVEFADYPIKEGISASDILHDEDEDNFDDLPVHTCEVNDATIVASNRSPSR